MLLYSYLSICDSVDNHKNAHPKGNFNVEADVNTILIQNFGPIGRAQINLDKNFQILIGEQASGKSTVSKVVYFCQKIRDYTLDFLLDETQFSEVHPNEYFNSYMKFLQRQFMGCFGTTKHMQKFRIVYTFQTNKITIELNDNGYIRYFFNPELKSGINRLINDAANMFLNEWNRESYCVSDR
ncbi:MAG: ATP-binding protein, partial [Roseburia sp.]|nr:ATP-binding protein [Roseburia sp.]